MADDFPGEGRTGVARIEAFSDGVLAISITIMVLGLEAPKEPGLAALLKLWPTFLAYLLSYAYVAIYWVNHHRLFSFARGVSNALVWSNMTLLFALSLIPFATAYLGQQHFSREASLLYLTCLFAAGLSYLWLEYAVRCTSSQGPQAQAFLALTIRKVYVAQAILLAGMVLSFVSPWLGVGAAAVVAVQWILPWRSLDRMLGS